MIPSSPPSLPFPEFEPGWVWLAGAGPGDPGLLTLHAWHALRHADVIVYDALVGPDILGLAREGCRLEFAGKRGGKPSPKQPDISNRLVQLARDGLRVLRLKGGDPFVFGRGAEEVLHCARSGVPVTVVPGITSAVAAPAAAGIPVTHRGVAQEFHVVSAHVPPGAEGSTVDWPALARSTGTLVLLMAVQHLGEIARSLLRYGRLPDTPVAVIQDGTLRAQRVLTATLETVADEMTTNHVRPPATIVVGDVVRVAREIEMLSAEMERDR
jgi:uroporphyrin-III C-methyltransferase